MKWENEATWVEKVEWKIGWSYPPPSFFKMNVDGARLHQNKSGYCGGIRNDRGFFIGGFTHNISECNMMEAKLWGVLNGLKIAWDASIKNLIMEVDYLCAVELVKTNINSLHSFYSMIC